MNDEIKVTIINQADREHYIARWTDPITGKRCHKTTGEANEQKAWKFANKLEQQLQSGTFQTSTSITWNGFRERLSQEFIPSLKEKTQLKYNSVLNGFEKLITVKKLASINAQHLSKYQAYLRGLGRSEATIKGNLSSIMSCLRWAESQDMLNKVPKVNMPKRAKTSKVMKGRPITGEEYDRLVSVVPEIVGEEYAESVIHLLDGLWWGGLRLGEALSLTWHQSGFCLVKMNERYFFQIEGESEKGNSNRFIPVAPQFEMMLPETPPKTGHVFQPRFHRLVTIPPRVDTMSDVIVRIGKRSGIVTNVKQVKGKGGRIVEKKTYASAHDLRRAFGTRWAPEVQPRILMEMMRHQSIETTMRYYVVGNAQQTSQTLWDVVNKKKSDEHGNKSSNKRTKPAKSQSNKKRNTPK